MDQNQFVSAVLMGCVLILLGVLPGLLDSIMDGTERLQDRLFLSGGGLHRRMFAPMKRMQRPIMLAAIGVGIIVLSTIAYFG